MLALEDMWIWMPIEFRRLSGRVYVSSYISDETPGKDAE
jgi:hypothetical protein